MMIETALNPEQQEVVLHGDGPCLVLAGADWKDADDHSSRGSSVGSGSASTGDITYIHE